MGKWKSKSSKIEYKSPFFEIEEHQVIRPDGTDGIYSVLHKSDFCVIVALTDKNQIYLIKQFRFPAQKEGWELPMGARDGDDPLGGAKRELQEETGLIAQHWDELQSFYPSSGNSDAKGIVFVARDLEMTNQDNKLEEGITDCRPFDREEIDQMILDGSIHDGPTIASLHIAQINGSLDSKS